jgi:hypothetical protein
MSERVAYSRYATSSARSCSSRREAAYSMCSARRGVCAVTLDEACTSRGRMETTTPRATVHSTASSSRASFWMAASDKTPMWCVPGRTRSGPFSRRGIIEVHAKREDPLQYASRCMGVDDTALLGPRTPPVRHQMTDAGPRAVRRLVEGPLRCRRGKSLRPDGESGIGSECVHRVIKLRGP